MDDLLIGFLHVQVNMVFLINIIRILVMKLRSAHSNEPSQYRFVKKHTLLLLDNLYTQLL